MRSSGARRNATSSSPSGRRTIGRERAVERVVAVDDDVLELGDTGRLCEGVSGDNQDQGRDCQERLLHAAASLAGRAGPGNASDLLPLRVRGASRRRQHRRPQALYQLRRRSRRREARLHRLAQLLRKLLHRRGVGRIFGEVLQLAAGRRRGRTARGPAGPRPTRCTASAACGACSRRTGAAAAAPSRCSTARLRPPPPPPRPARSRRVTCVSAQPRPAAPGSFSIGTRLWPWRLLGGFTPHSSASVGNRSTCADRRLRDAALRRDAGRDDQQRHAGALLEQAHLLPQAVLAHVVAVVAGEDDDRVVGQPEPIERVDDAADLRVHEADAGVIRLHAPGGAGRR